jgi:hypothetical protein
MFDNAMVTVDVIAQALARHLRYQHLGQEEPSPLPCLRPNTSYRLGRSSIGALADGWKHGGC